MEIIITNLTKAGKKQIAGLDEFIDYFKKAKQGVNPPQITLSKTDYEVLEKSFKGEKPDEITYRGIILKSK